ncbi:MAG: pyridoxal 5'-phosphate synthase glutaminase subunit PdxT [Thermoplasmata archaeon]|nr:pyridoxal 5'-phosphate synthase glutaminase subunit PdxT [Thermoplasmata archaeon]MCI4356617.1 pyridoxal 5'-phosphate synthase glutaminase subunit PdxT [Thermoplasmata archaeon]
MTTVGVLALQGDVPEHRAAFAGVVGPQGVRLVRTPHELAGVDALVIPGGESTAISELIDRNGLRLPLQERIGRGLPVLGTCAGLILLAERLEPSRGGRDPTGLRVLDVSVRRNEFGRQRESFEDGVRVTGLQGDRFPGVFIRAPRILEVGRSAKPFAWRGDEVVGVRSPKIWGLTFHPELSGDPRLAEAFLRETGASD